MGQNSIMQKFSSSSNVSDSGKLNLLKFPDVKEDINQKLIGVIVTLCDQSSYDTIFTEIPQKPDEGTRVRVYTTNSDYLPNIIAGLKGDIPKNCVNNDVLKDLIQDINSLEADNVVFNWECCSGCASQSFTFKDQKEYFKMIRFLVDKGFFLMFSDFSLKALITQWQESILGPNPFKQIGTTSAQFILKFDPQKLQECDSSQLQKVGDLCSQGFCNVHALSGTIVYTVDQKKAKNDNYSCQVLTVVTKTDCYENPLSLLKENEICQIGDNKGCAGHVILSFPKGGGKILTSMGHWIELMKLDTSTEELLKLAQRDFGEDYVKNMQAEMDCLQSESEKQEYRSKKAAYFVQSAMPQKNSYNLEKRNKKS